MLNRYMHIILFGVMLAVAATLVLSSDAQAMASACCCPPDNCGCAGCTQHKAQEPASMLKSPDMSNSCSCSTGPNPFSTDVATVVCIDPPNKRFFQPLADVVAAVHSLPLGLPCKRYKPPSVPFQRLYLLNNSFLI